jgi:hypothetical protein
MTKGIIFSDDYATYANESTFVGVLKGGIASKNELILEYKRNFHFPYGNFNWDSLDELLTDFHWLDATRVVIAHTDLPALDEEDLNIYIDILSNISFYDPGRELKEFSQTHGIKAFDGVIAVIPNRYKHQLGQLSQ